MQITYTQQAWINPQFMSVDQVRKGDAEPYLTSSAPSGGGYYEQEGYLHIGVAEISLTIIDDAEATKNQIAALNRKLESVRAESQQRENAILLKISKLQALTMEVAEA